MDTDVGDCNKSHTFATTEPCIKVERSEVILRVSRCMKSHR